MSYAEHDLVTANTQAATHAAFLSMGTAWHCSASYPWETNRYTGGIEHIKINIALRIYANKWHVYAGLALLNPSAKVLIEQYARSTTELFKLMVEGKKAELRSRVFAARDKVFLQPAAHAGEAKRTPLLLSDRILDQFSLGPPPEAGSPKPPRNSHLSLLAMADTWAALSINPFADLDLAATPLFRMWIGVAEYLFREEDRLDEAVDAAIDDRAHRADDTEFVVAARGWSQCVEMGAWETYRERFERTAGTWLTACPIAKATRIFADPYALPASVLLATVPRGDQGRRRDDQGHLSPIGPAGGDLDGQALKWPWPEDDQRTRMSNGFEGGTTHERAAQESGGEVRVMVEVRGPGLRPEELLRSRGNSPATV